MDSMAWNNNGNPYPSQDGLYVIFAPTLDDKTNDISLAFFTSSGSTWHIVAGVFLQGITQWMEIPGI